VAWESHCASLHHLIWQCNRLKLNHVKLTIEQRAFDPWTLAHPFGGWVLIKLTSDQAYCTLYASPRRRSKVTWWQLFTYYVHCQPLTAPEKKCDGVMPTVPSLMVSALLHIDLDVVLSPIGLTGKGC
jgi:hypothetical protein